MTYGRAIIYHYARALSRRQNWRQTPDLGADPFDTGRRLPDTGMLDLAQQFTRRATCDTLPPAYRAALDPCRPAELR